MNGCFALNRACRTVGGDTLDLHRGSRRLLAQMLICYMGVVAVVAGNDELLAAPPAPRYQFRQDHDPNGIGKFYMGREIARVMTFHGAPWLERPEREEEERLSTLVECLSIKPGEVVADIGAGSGVITLMMARAVTNTGVVYAVDIQQEMLDLLSDKLNRLDVKNVKLLLGAEQATNLPAEAIDLALLVDVYHELEFPFELAADMSRALKPGGRLVLVEYRREDPEVPIKLIHKMSQAQVRKELEIPELNLRWKETIDKLPRQHVMVFEKQPVIEKNRSDGE
jgi:precorrin-6B methylase 2